MLTLAINTSTPFIQLALFKRNKLLASSSWESRADESEKLLTGIMGLHAELKDLARIVVCCGPGSFSALRIGVTVANTLAFALKIPLWGISPEYWNTLPSLAKASRKKIVAPKYALPPKITSPNPKS